MRRLVATAVASAVLSACGADGPAPGSRQGGSATTPPAPTTTLPAPVALARELVAAETAIRDPATPPAEVAAAGRAQQRAYGSLVAHPEWDAEVLALVPPALQPVVAANVEAGRQLMVLNGPVEPDRPLPKWRIVAPDPPEQLIALYREAGAAAGGVPWTYLAAIHLVETRMGRIRGDSVAGAQGPMQFIPTTWDIYGRGGDITSNRDSIFAAARLLRANGAPANMARALRAYNNSARYVTAVTRYAEQMAADERAYLGYHAWQVYFGSRLLPEGTVTG